MAGSRQIVLCFDGTENTFTTNGPETNVLKICRMLERTDEQLCYYQPGTGTDITPGSLANATLRKHTNLSNSKALNLALGKSFDRHVLGGYRFLMRHYREGTRIYIFGFSRGAYAARFLNEMVDFVGLLGPDNEEVLPVIWDAFAAWKLDRTNNKQEAKKRAYTLMKCSRETLAQPVPRVHFLGMFDAVNSVADFDVNMDEVPSTKTIRHAVSIDERRIKFRPVLLGIREEQPPPAPKSRRQSSERNSQDDEASTPSGPPVLPEIPHVSTHSRSHDVRMVEDQRDIEEMWFPGGHTDIGGGWNLEAGEAWPLSHAPLVWMVGEARNAGLRLDPWKMKHLACIPECNEDDTSDDQAEKAHESSNFMSNSQKDFMNALQIGGMKGRIHDLLACGQGLSIRSVLSWRFMEWLPLRRMELQSDGKWKAVRWPPPLGQSRDIPTDAQVHISAIQRMRCDASYRPSNLTYGLSEGDSGIGKWGIYSHEGDPVRERYVREDVQLP
ncbi:unnamed protein product [Penicillium salamii]|uniref:T6SS Phospholipase effector Tle1-like catalytic domain-containing protein n=1 Tax=Penicillium salamii TaxID=1612424 RepID=A0A9W4JDR9_9EURO|nr:unnamed protein product [Penicillium salamii]